MKALVTGGGGFLGLAICRRLAGRGDKIVSFSRGLHPELAALGVETRRGDLADREAVFAAAEGCDVVFHAGAKAGLWGPAEEFERTNVDGTRFVIEACRRHRIRRLVYTSSPSVVFGGADIEGGDESLPYPESFEADYPRSKAAAERLVRAAAGPALATVALRPHLIWGPGDPHILPRLVAKRRAGELRRVAGPAKLVDSVYVDNAADAHLAAGDRLAQDSPISGKVYFISNGEPLPLWELIDALLRAARLEPVDRTISPRAAYLAGAALETVYRWLRIRSEPRLTRFLARELSTAHWFDIGAARRDLGYAPRVSIAEGLKRLEASLFPEPAPASR